mmetsp:Transcript_20672/g.31928  ORF Transcript_20672/g.31928 Transcript_20672/m.31928 type:complete len:221 (+) Transcript_20672:58-720(+)
MLLTWLTRSRTRSNFSKCQRSKIRRPSYKVVCVFPHSHGKCRKNCNKGYQYGPKPSGSKACYRFRVFFVSRYLLRTCNLRTVPPPIDGSRRLVSGPIDPQGRPHHRGHPARPPHASVPAVGLPGRPVRVVPRGAVRPFPRAAAGVPVEGSRSSPTAEEQHAAARTVRDQPGQVLPFRRGVDGGEVAAPGAGAGVMFVPGQDVAVYVIFEMSARAACIPYP